MPKRLLLIIASFLVHPVLAEAQEMPTATRGADADWYRASFNKFKEGQAGTAREIIYEHFIKADEASGRNPIAFNFVTGEWDHVVFFPLQGGPSDLEWDIRPIDAQWWEALAELEGGIEQAQALVRRFGEMVERTETHIVRRRQ